MTGAEGRGDPGRTAFDALVEKMKSDVEAGASADDHAGHMSLLQSIFENALADAGGVRDQVIGRLNEGKERVRSEIRAHPVASISAAFTAGYVIGRAIAGKARK
ncbi:MAG: hypothetical protein ACK4NP_10130 [Parvularculaceae bacterium]